MKSRKEQQFTSTTTKLLNNLELLNKVRHGIFTPQSIQLAPTDKCNLKCTFCSVKNREGKELTLQECKHVLRTFRDLGAKTVELTGGGDITMYKDINYLLNKAYYLGYKVGMITNGILLNKNIDQKFIDRLTWLRVSLNGWDYNIPLDIKVSPKVVLGFSYVWNSKSTPHILEIINAYAKKMKARYVRIVPNCLNVKEIEKYKKDIAPYIDKYPRFFLQQKETMVPYRCWMGYIKPFVNSDGYVYHCSANPLIERKFNSKFRMCRISDIKSKWSKVKPFNTKNCLEGKCFFKEHNDLLEQIMLDVEHKDFI